MNRTSWGFPLVLLVVLFLAGVGCRQDESDGPPATPPIVPAPVEDVDSGQPYPAPDRSEQLSGDPYPAPSEPPPDQPESPPPVTDPGDGAAGGGSASSPGAQPTPVEPVFETAAGAVEPLPDAQVVSRLVTGGSAIPAGTTVEHTVIRGDWLLQIARCYGTTYTAVRDANAIRTPDYLRPGTTLTVPNVGSAGQIVGPPCVQTYVAGAGETWDSIAAQFETTPVILQRVNPGPLSVGRELFVPATGQLVAVDLPALTNHLLFIHDGDLAVWRASDSQVEVTRDETAEILDIATNSDGRFILARQTRDGGATSEIALMDTVARTAQVLQGGLPPHTPPLASFDQMLISPDGGWGVYPILTESGYRLTSFQTAAPDTLYVGPELPSQGGSAVLPMQLFPGSDSTRFLVSGESGLHEFPYSLDLTGRELVGLTGDLQVDPVATLFATSWDPGGRYLLANGALMEGGAAFVVDGETGEMAQVPGSDAYVIAPGISWTEAGQLLVVEPTAAGQLGPLGSLYEVSSTPALAVTPGETQVLQTRDTQAGADAQLGYVILMPPVQPVGGRFYLAIQGATDEQGVWATAQGVAASLVRLVEMPPDAYQMVWSADVSEALAVAGVDPAGPRTATYLPLDDRPAFGLSDWLGGRSSDFYWLVPR